MLAVKVKKASGLVSFKIIWLHPLCFTLCYEHTFQLSGGSLVLRLNNPMQCRYNANQGVYKYVLVKRELEHPTLVLGILAT